MKQSSAFSGKSVAVLCFIVAGWLAVPDPLHGSETMTATDHNPTAAMTASTPLCPANPACVPVSLLQRLTGTRMIPEWHWTRKRQTAQVAVVREWMARFGYSELPGPWSGGSVNPISSSLDPAPGVSGRTVSDKPSNAVTDDPSGKAPAADLTETGAGLLIPNLTLVQQGMGHHLQAGLPDASLNGRSSLELLQIGNNHRTNGLVVAHQSSIVLLQRGSGHRAGFTQQGRDHSMVLNQNKFGNRITARQNGSGNRITVHQSEWVFLNMWQHS